MSDAIGAAWLPALVPTMATAGSTSIMSTRAPGDPALVTLGSYLATVMQDRLNDAWAILDTSSSVVLPGTIDGTRDGVGIVRRVFYHDPKYGDFVTPDLPALFVYRQTKTPTKYKRNAQDSHRRTQSIVATWVAPPTDLTRQRGERDPFMNVVNGVVHHALTFKKDPSWTIAADDRDLDGLKTAFATSTSEATITSFNGALASTTMRAARPVAITNTAVAGAYATGDIVVTGTDSRGRALTATLAFTTANGGETIVTILRFATVTSIVFPAMLLGTGSMTVGYYDSPDKRGGSLVQRACQFAKMDLTDIRYQPFEIVRSKGEDPVKLLGLEAVIEVAEDQFWDPDVHATTPYTVEAHVQRTDGTDYQSLELES